MGCTRAVVIILLIFQVIPTAAMAGERKSAHDTPIAASSAPASGRLDRVVFAVDGAESSHGMDIAMWRPDLSGPQGPMQVSEAAATDVGGGDRFDAAQNRALGRAYLAQLYWRYQNWPDAIAAYNWGVGNMDAWVKAGRPADKLVVGVASYLTRVLHDSGLCDGSGTAPRRQPAAAAPQVPPACADLDAWGGAFDAKGRPFFGVMPSRFSKKLDQAMQLALRHALGP
jgi:transglycosylase-like protein with SLT domain